MKFKKNTLFWWEFYWHTSKKSKVFGKSIKKINLQYSSRFLLFEMKTIKFYNKKGLSIFLRKRDEIKYTGQKTIMTKNK